MSTKNDPHHGVGGAYVMNPTTGQREPDPAWLKQKEEPAAKAKASPEATARPRADSEGPALAGADTTKARK